MKITEAVEELSQRFNDRAWFKGIGVVSSDRADGTEARIVVYVTAIRPAVAAIKPLLDHGRYQGWYVTYRLWPVTEISSRLSAHADFRQG